MKLVTACALLCACTVARPALGTYLQLDDFNRSNSTAMGANWTEQYPDFYVTSDAARSSDLAMMTWNAPLPSGEWVGADVTHNDAAASQYGALVLDYASLTQNVFIKLQDTGNTGDFDRLYFNYGNNGGPWSGMTGGLSYVTIAPTHAARIRARVDGSTVTVQIDSNMDGKWDQTFSRGSLPTAGLSTGFGLAATKNPILDNFGVYIGEPIPEPATGLLAGGALLIAGRRRIRH